MLLQPCTKPNGHWNHKLSNGNTLSKALRNSAPIAEKRIADALEIHPMIIWPSRYHANGERKLQRFRKIQSTRRQKPVNGKDSAVNSHEQA
ncbi:helix-turn-helix domain-containing protein [Methylobacter tundripaludum]|uniref:helix-turn-helix domain-containing protein n=1 Tax=Methylobacter tundripaludum TaxID=173365 RepID=UPI00190FA6FF